MQFYDQGCIFRSEIEMKKAFPTKKKRVPKILQRKYEIVFIPSIGQKPLAVREVRSESIGGLVKVRGIVTRITEVKPFVQVATYTCDNCGCEIYQRVNSRQYKPQQLCEVPMCKEKKYTAPLREMTRGFKFTKFQELKLQELPEEVPVGHVPRSMTVYLFGERTRNCQCGDKVTVSGVWLPAPYSGWKAMKTGLTCQTYLHGMHICKTKKGHDVNQHSQELLDQAEEASKEPEIYDKLAKSLAPEFYGMESIKKVLLLLLIGDPGVAKSQLLRAVCRLAPRAVYTTGKGSSGVGLTAAVLRDKITKDVVLEAGALVLADMGICCIDEFDKMEESDRSAIHEVMEQQTVSIAKAGVTTTLNARTAVMAAANPAFGRYDKRRTPEQNINIPAALLSRFDIVWVMVDKSDTDRDLSLARHIAYVHQHDTYPQLDFEAYSQDFMRAYIAKARTFEPTIPKALTEFVVKSYIQVRQDCLGEDGQYNSRKIIGTPRALLSILRLAQAKARLHYRTTVNQSDVEEAMRLLRESKKSTQDDIDEKMDTEDVTSRIWNAIKDFLMNKRNKKGKLADLEELLTTKGFESDDITACINEYVDMDVLVMPTNKKFLQIVSNGMEE